MIRISEVDISLSRAPDGVFSKEDTGRRIDTWLTYRNPMSTREAARRCGIPFETMRRFRNGERRPAPRTLDKLARIGLTPSYVYGKGADEMIQYQREKAADSKVIADYLSLSREDKKAVQDLLQRLKSADP